MIEHIGLGRYKDPLDIDGDKQAMSEIRRLLKPGGTLLLTVPFGKTTVTKLHRVYSYDKLMHLLAGLDVVKEDYFIWDGKFWSSTSKDHLSNIDSSRFVYGIACLKTKKI